MRLGKNNTSAAEHLHLLDPPPTPGNRRGSGGLCECLGWGTRIGILQLSISIDCKHDDTLALLADGVSAILGYYIS